MLVLHKNGIQWFSDEYGIYEPSNISYSSLNHWITYNIPYIRIAKHFPISTNKMEGYCRKVSTLEGYQNFIPDNLPYATNAVTHETHKTQLDLRHVTSRHVYITRITHLDLGIEKNQ